MSTETTTGDVQVTDTTNTAAADTTSTASTETTEGQGQGEAGKTVETTEAAKGDESKATEETTTEGVPEQYEAFQLPEGFTLEGERLEMAHEFARANGWNQAKAQEGVDTYLKFRAADLQMERELWAQESQKEWGEKFPELSRNVQAVGPEIEKLRPGFSDRMEKLSLGNHPDVLWLINKYGELTRGDSMRGVASESAGSGQPKTIAERMYPGMK